MAELCQNEWKIFSDISDHSNRYAKSSEQKWIQSGPSMHKRKTCIMKNEPGLSHFEACSQLLFPNKKSSVSSQKLSKV